MQSSSVGLYPNCQNTLFVINAPETNTSSNTFAGPLVLPVGKAKMLFLTFKPVLPAAVQDDCGIFIEVGKNCVSGTLTATWLYVSNRMSSTASGPGQSLKFKVASASPPAVALEPSKLI